MSRKTSEGGLTAHSATFDDPSGARLERIVTMAGGDSDPGSKNESISRYPSSKNYSYRDEDDDSTFMDNTAEDGELAALLARFRNFMSELRREIIMEPTISMSKCMQS